MDAKEAFMSKLLFKRVIDEDYSTSSQLLERGANPNLVLEDGASPFHVAVGIDNDELSEEFTKLLLANGADPNVKSAEGLTPVHIAATYGRCVNLRLLLRNGGDPTVQDQDDKDAFVYARQSGCPMCEMLLDTWKADTETELSESVHGYSYNEWHSKADNSARNTMSMTLDPETSDLARTDLPRMSDLARPKLPHRKAPVPGQSPREERKETWSRQQQYSPLDYTVQVQKQFDEFNPTFHQIDVTSPDHPVLLLRHALDDTLLQDHASPGDANSSGSASYHTCGNSPESNHTCDNSPESNPTCNNSSGSDHTCDDSPGSDHTCDDSPGSDNTCDDSPGSQNADQRKVDHEQVSKRLGTPLRNEDDTTQLCHRSPSTCVSTPHLVKDSRTIEPRRDLYKVLKPRFEVGNSQSGTAKARMGSSPSSTGADMVERKDLHVSSRCSDKTARTGSSDDFEFDGELLLELSGLSMASDVCDPGADIGHGNSCSQAEKLPTELFADGIKGADDVRDFKGSSMDSGDKSLVDESGLYTSDESLWSQVGLPPRSNRYAVRIGNTTSPRRAAWSVDSGVGSGTNCSGINGSQSNVIVQSPPHGYGVHPAMWCVKSEVDKNIALPKRQPGNLQDNNIKQSSEGNTSCKHSSRIPKCDFLDPNDFVLPRRPSASTDAAGDPFPLSSSRRPSLNDASQLPHLNVSRVSTGSMTSKCSCGSRQRPERHVYTDKDDGFSLLETRVDPHAETITVSHDPSCSTHSQVDLTILYDWKESSHMTAAATDSDGSLCSIQEELVVPGSIKHLTDQALRVQLLALGDEPGPISDFTRLPYERRLVRLRNNPELAAVGRSREAGFLLEINQALRGELELSSVQALEEKMAAPFHDADPGRRWREGTLKASFTYLLLDPRVTQNLPARAKHMEETEALRVFLRAVFYVGKGKRSRPYAHFREAIHHITRPAHKPASRKVQQIMEVWEAGHGVVSLHVFQNVIPVEAYTREACMIEALGRQRLTNIKGGERYGPAASWTLAKRRLLGAQLLRKACKILLLEGERQIRPHDVKLTS